MKKPKTVIYAEAALAAKAGEVAASKEALKRLETEHGAAYKAVRQAQADADANFPQCRLVLVRWRTSKQEDIGRVVILRRTPGGLLIVRYVGEPYGSEYRFKWSEHSRKFRQAERGGYTDDTRELRDVPVEYQPSDLGGPTLAITGPQGPVDWPG